MENPCEFRLRCAKDTWTFWPKRSPRSMRTPRYGAGQQGIPKGPPRRQVRCPLCNRRLFLRAAYCIGGEFVSWYLPPHKDRETRPKSPRRKSRKSGRGK